MRNRFSVVVLLVALFLISASGLATAASFSPSVQKGVDWLSSQVQSDGSLTAEPAAMGSALQCRVESEYTLALLAAPSAPLVNAITADAADDTESLARRIFALSASGGDVGALIDVLNQRQNTDGGFSAQMLSSADSTGFSNLLDSAWGLIALTAANIGGNAAALAARDFLMAGIDAGGGMTGFSDGDGVQAAALSLIALSATPPSAVLTTTLNGMATWLASRQAADGSWLGDAYLTGIALYAIAPQAIDGAVRDKARAFLVGRQGQDGSWQADPFLTAVVLRALVQDGGIQNGPPTKVVGKVVDAKGGAPLMGATVTLTPTGGAPLTATTTADGAFSFGDDLAAGDYSLSVSKADYAAASVPSLTVVAGQTKDAGIFALSQNATAGVVRGTVTDGISGYPLAGVAVKLATWGSGRPAYLMNAITDASGNYEFSGLQLPLPYLNDGATMTFSLAGYQSVTSTTFYVTGSVILFSPALYPTNTAIPTTINISGKVVDTAGIPLAGVTITSPDTSFLNGKTALDGSFSFGGWPTISSSITYSLAGYQAYTQRFTSPAGANVDLGTVVLSNLATSTSIFGKVKNQANSSAIVGATVQLNGLVATTDSTGAYTFNNLRPPDLRIDKSMGYCILSDLS